MEVYAFIIESFWEHGEHVPTYITIYSKLEHAKEAMQRHVKYYKNMGHKIEERKENEIKMVMKYPKDKETNVFRIEKKLII